MKPGRALTEAAARVLAAEARRRPDVSENLRAEAVHAIARAIERQSARRRRLRWLAAGAIAIAAAVVIGIGLRAAVPERRANESSAVVAAPAPAELGRAVTIDGAVVVVRQTSRQPLRPGDALAAGDRLVVADASHAALGFMRGTRLTIDANSEVALASGGPTYAFELARGAVRSDVAKLEPSERFVIRTADAEVEVRGTSFKVARVDAQPLCGDGTTTRVFVYEGIVAVRARGAEALVHAGEMWPAGCVAESTTVPAPSVAPAPANRATAPTERSAPALASPSNRMSPPTPSSSPTAGPDEAVARSNLAEQNDLFAKAVARKRGGDVSGAIGALDDLLARFPSSHLAQSAHAERMKLLHTTSSERARAAAREYLARYPNGFARADAELILSESK